MELSSREVAEELLLTEQNLADRYFPAAREQILLDEQVYALFPLETGGSVVLRAGAEPVWVRESPNELIAITGDSFCGSYLEQRIFFHGSTEIERKKMQFFGLKNMFVPLDGCVRRESSWIGVNHLTRIRKLTDGRAAVVFGMNQAVHLNASESQVRDCLARALHQSWQAFENTSESLPFDTRGFGLKVMVNRWIRQIGMEKEVDRLKIAYWKDRCKGSRTSQTSRIVSRFSLLLHKELQPEVYWNMVETLAEFDGEYVYKSR